MPKYSPLLSVIMPAYNAEKYIDASIKSMISQSYTNWELIIIDDGSTDSTATIVHRWMKQDDRIRFIQQKNSGKPSIARNKGITVAQGSHISFLDADDIYLPHRLKRAVDAFHNTPEISLCFCDYAMSNEHGDCLDAHYLTTKNFITKSHEFLTTKSQGFLCNTQFIRFISTEMTVIHTNNITFRKDLLAAEPFAFNEKMTIGEDIDFWFRLINKKLSFYIPEVLTDYKVHPTSITKDPEALLLGTAETHQINFIRVNALLSPTERATLSYKLSNYYSDLGYYYRTHHQKKKSVKYYWHSFTYHKNVKNLFNIAKAIFVV